MQRDVKVTKGMEGIPPFYSFFVFKKKKGSWVVRGYPRPL